MSKSIHVCQSYCKPMGRFLRHGVEALDSAPPLRHVLPGSISGSVIQIAIKNLIVRSVPHCQHSLEISCKSIQTYRIRIRIRIPDPDRYQDLTVCSFLENFMQIRSEVFCAKLPTKRQTDKQANNDENITCFAEVAI